MKWKYSWLLDPFSADDVVSQAEIYNHHRHNLEGKLLNNAKNSLHRFIVGHNIKEQKRINGIPYFRIGDIRIEAGLEPEPMIKKSRKPKFTLFFPRHTWLEPAVFLLALVIIWNIRLPKEPTTKPFVLSDFRPVLSTSKVLKIEKPERSRIGYTVNSPASIWLPTQLVRKD